MFAKLKAGDKYNKLTAIEIVGEKGGSKVWKLRCECGKETKVKATHVTRGRTKSCGCISNALRSASMKVRYRAKSQMVSIRSGEQGD